MDLILTKLAKTWDFHQLGNYDLKIDVHNNVTMLSTKSTARHISIAYNILSLFYFYKH